MLSCSVMSSYLTVACQALLPMEFSRQKYWSRLPFPTPGIEPTSLASPALAGRFFTTSTTWEAPNKNIHFSAQSCLTVSDPMDCSMPGFLVYHQLQELAQTHVRWLDDAIQPSHPLLCPYPAPLNLSQHQGLFQWVTFSHQVAKVLRLQLLPQSFHWILRTISFRIDWLDLLAVQKTLMSLLQHHSSNNNNINII